MNEMNRKRNKTQTKKTFRLFRILIGDMLCLHVCVCVHKDEAPDNQKKKLNEWNRNIRDCVMIVAI